jgi:hypothetical protein
MKKYRVIANAATFHSGTLQLTEKQFASRKYALSATKKAGEFRILGPVQFKRGEEIGFDGEVNKILLQNLSHVAEAEDPKGKPGPKGKE